MSTCYCEYCLGPEKTEQLHEASADMLNALERLTGFIYDLNNVYQQEFAAYLIRQESFKIALAAIRKAKGEA